MHGIMVSLNGGSWADAVWKWSNAQRRFCGVPLENEYDVDQIADMVQPIYTWMRNNKKGEDMADTVRSSRQRHFSVCGGPRGL
jgi:hypothetical protein